MVLETKSDWAYAIIGFIIVVAVAIGGVWVYNKLTWQPSFQVENETVQDEGVTMTFVSGTEYKPGQEGQVIVELREPKNGSTLLDGTTTFIEQQGNLGNSDSSQNYGCMGFFAKADVTLVKGTLASPNNVVMCYLLNMSGTVIANSNETAVVVANATFMGDDCVLNYPLKKDVIYYLCAGNVIGDPFHVNTWKWNVTYPTGGTYINVTGAFTPPPWNIGAATLYDLAAGYAWQNYTIDAPDSNCRASVWYPDKSEFITEMPMAVDTGTGNGYINFTTPNIDGVYEYQATCSAKGANRTASKSFHVTQQRIKAVVVK